MLAISLPTFEQALAERQERALASLRTAGLANPAVRVGAFLNQFQDLPPCGTFKYVPPAAHALFMDAVTEGGPASGPAFLLASLLTALRNSLEGSALARLPARVRRHQLRQFERIARHDADFLQHCRLNGDVFLKEFGLATLRLYAGASSVIDPRSGIGRSMLWKGGAAQLLPRALLFARAGGFKPYFEIHVNKLYQDEFNEEGRNECYRCCAELYELHPEALGMFGGSWFYDPQLAHISPHLSYLRTVPESGGARALFDAYDQQAVGNATATSATRRNLHAAGKYRPASWVLVWPKRAQLAWARRQRKNDN
jgi:hypothetical protein